MKSMLSLFSAGLICLLGLVAVDVRWALAQSAASASSNRVALVFSGGHETDPRDHGRPVVLVAGALGVKPEVFREAFSHVHPARAGSEPEPQQVRENKAALLKVLGKYGVTNDRLDEVSNYYRYVQSRGELWPVKSAAGYALVEKGQVVRYVITDAGRGYSSPPKVSVTGMSGLTPKADLKFDPDFAKNGSVSAVR